MEAFSPNDNSCRRFQKFLFGRVYAVCVGKKYDRRQVLSLGEKVTYYQGRIAFIFLMHIITARLTVLSKNVHVHIPRYA